MPTNILQQEIGYNLIFWAVLALETLIILSVGILALCIRWWQDHKQRKSQRLYQAVYGSLFKRIQSGKPIPFDAIPHQARTLKYLLPIMEHLDTKFANQNWLTFKQQVAEMYFQPRIRKMARSWSWMERSYAVRCLDFSRTKEFEGTIIKLLNDGVPLIRFQAVRCAVALATEPLLREMLRLMSIESRFARYTYIDTLQQAPLEIHQRVEEYYLSCKDPDIRLACLEVLSRRPTGKITEQVLEDASAEILNLALAAVRTLGKTSLASSVQKLTELLKDTRWEVRAQAASGLGKLGNPKSIGDLGMALRDSQWWVRMNSALALQKLGEEGVTVLQRQDPDLDMFAYETAQYVLALDG